jgi:hypothetical protein
MSSSSGISDRVELHLPELWYRDSGSSTRFFVSGAELARAVGAALKTQPGKWALIPSRHNSLLPHECREVDGDDMRGDMFWRETNRLLIMRPQLIEQALRTPDPGATASLTGCVFLDFNALGSGVSLEPSAAMVVNRVRSKLTGEVEPNIEGPRLYAALKKSLRQLLVHEVAVKLKTGEVVLERGLLASTDAALVLKTVGKETCWRLA